MTYVQQFLILTRIRSRFYNHTDDIYHPVWLVSRTYWARVHQLLVNEFNEVEEPTNHLPSRPRDDREFPELHLNTLSLTESDISWYSVDDHGQEGSQATEGK